MSKTDLESAARRWSETFDRVPGSVIRKMAENDESMRCYDSDSLLLLAGPSAECNNCLEPYDGPCTVAELLDGGKEACPECDDNPGDVWAVSDPARGFPCGHDVLFSPRDPEDRQWILDNAHRIAQLGFFVFSTEEYGCLLGTDDYDFDEGDCWTPLFRLRRGTDRRHG